MGDAWRTLRVEWAVNPAKEIMVAFEWKRENRPSAALLLPNRAIIVRFTEGISLTVEIPLPLVEAVSAAKEILVVLFENAGIIDEFLVRVEKPIIEGRA